MRNILTAAIVALLGSMTGTAIAAEAPVALAAWSQITGSTDQTAAGRFVPPSVEMRFVVAAGSDCSNYTASYDTASAKGQASGLKASGRTGPWTDIVVCVLPMDSTWTAATLEVTVGSGNQPVVPNSMLNRGTISLFGSKNFHKHLKGKDKFEFLYTPF